MKKNNLICVVQVKMESKRLRNKAMLDLCGMSMFERVVRRTLLSSWYYDELIVAGVDSKANDVIEDICNSNNWRCIRSKIGDVLGQFYYIASITNARHIIRICADNPFIDPEIINKTISTYLLSDVDYITTMPVDRETDKGMHVEIFSRETLNKTWHDVELLSQVYVPQSILADYWHYAEHVTPYIYNNPDKFKIKVIDDTDGYSKYRFDVDTMEDYRRARFLYSKFGNAGFSWKDVANSMDRSCNE